MTKVSKWDKIINILLKWIVKVDSKRKCQLSNYCRLSYYFVEIRKKKTNSNNNLNKNRQKVKKKKTIRILLFLIDVNQRLFLENTCMHMWSKWLAVVSHHVPLFVFVASFPNAATLLLFPFLVFTVTFFFVSFPFFIFYLNHQ